MPSKSQGRQDLITGPATLGSRVNLASAVWVDWWVTPDWSVYQSGFSREAQAIQAIKKKCILRNWLTQMWGVSRLTFIRWVCRLEAQTELMAYSWDRMSSFPETSGFALWLSTDWMWLTHPVEGNVLHLKSTDYRC